MKKLFLLFITLHSSFLSPLGELEGASSLNAQTIELDDVVNYAYYPSRVTSLNSMPDGETYGVLTDRRRMLVRYSYKTGAPVDTVINLTKARMLKSSDDSKKPTAFLNYIISPDGANILIETNRKEIYRRSFTAEYYIYNVRNHTLTPLSAGGPQECPKFSPDGSMIAFVRDNNIFLVKLLYNNAESQITTDGKFNQIINGKPDWVYEEEFEYNCAYDFSSDSQMLAWVRFDESQVPTFPLMYFKGTEPEMTDNILYPNVYEYKYPKAGERNSKVSVHSYDIKSRVTRNMQVPLDSDSYIPRIQFTRDADRLAVLTLNRRQNQCDIYMVNPRSCVAQLAVRETSDTYIETTFYANLDFSKPQFVLVSERDGYRHLYLYSSTGQLVRQLTQGEFVVNDFYGSDSEVREFYFSSNEGSPLEQYIYKVDQKGKRTRLTAFNGFHSAQFSNGCKYFVDTYSDINTPPVTAVCTADGKQLRVLEDNAALKTVYGSLNISKPEIFTFTTSEGIQLNGWMVKPAGFNPSQKYPVIMYQYSGPGNQQVHNSWSNGVYGGLIWEHRLTQKGYIVVCVDGRGTGGRGEKFQKCTYMTMGDKESKDQVETALYLGSLPYVDKDRIAIWGWSFGGFNTIMSMCEGRPVFRCGAAVAPVTDWRFYDTAYTERYMRRPQENPNGYDISPLHRYKRLHGDLLICHGLTDDNVHYQNCAELVECLVQADIQFEMQVYTNRNHSIYGGNTRKHLFRRIENFFDSKLMNK